MPRNSLKQRQFENEMSADLAKAEVSVRNYTNSLALIFARLVGFRDDAETKGQDKTSMTSAITDLKTEVQVMLDVVV